MTLFGNSTSIFKLTGPTNVIPEEFISTRNGSGLEMPKSKGLKIKMELRRHCSAQRFFLVQSISCELAASIHEFYLTQQITHAKRVSSKGGLLLSELEFLQGRFFERRLKNQWSWATNHIFSRATQFHQLRRN